MTKDMSILVLYIVAALLGIVGGVGIINPDINKITSGIHFFGMIGVIFYLFPRYSGWNIIGLIIISLVFSFISFSAFANRKS